MTQEELNKKVAAKPGCLVHAEWLWKSPQVFGGGSISVWVVGMPQLNNKITPFITGDNSKWICRILILAKHESINPPANYLVDTDIISFIPPQDIVKYLPYLTDVGAKYLKELKL